jgi:hypothetical protein
LSALMIAPDRRRVNGIESGRAGGMNGGGNDRAAAGRTPS